MVHKRQLLRLITCERWNGPCARPNGYCSPQSHFSAAGEPVGLCEFSRKRRALPLKARECSVRSHKGTGFPPLYQQVNQLTQMAPGVMGCFVVLLTRELAHKVQDTQSLMGLIWLRHACARMGHQIAASPMVRYIQHGGRNQSVAVNSLSWLGNRRHVRYSSSTPPQPERERHSHADVKSEGGQTSRSAATEVAGRQP